MGVSAALLAVLVVKIHPDHVVPAKPTAGTLAFLVAGLVLMAGSFVLAAWRWQTVLAVFDAHVSLRTLFKHYLAGQFVGNVLPSTIGGDVLRVSRSSKDVGGARDVAFAAVVLERLTGIDRVALPHVRGIRGPPRSRRPRSEPGRPAHRGLDGRSCSRSSLALAASPRLAGRFAHHENWMRYVGIVHIGVNRLRHDPSRRDGRDRRGDRRTRLRSSPPSTARST